MEKRSNVSRNAAALLGVGLIATPLTALSTPAFASSEDCTKSDPAATEVLPGVCELQFVESGDFTFTAPSGVSKLSAVIVGAGGNYGWASGDYAGGGGAVVYVASVDTSAALDIEVGLGASEGAPQGGQSAVNSDVAPGGFSGTNNGSTGCQCGGSSGNGNAGWINDVYAAAGGAGGAAPSQSVGGPGLTASAVANDSTMWPAVLGEPEYGAGGSIVGLGSIAGVAGAGANSDGIAGEDGLVILRWTSSLPNTGLASTTLAAFAAAFIIPGAALLAVGMRGRSNIVGS